MTCDCRHNDGGLCVRYPKTNTVVMGKLVWAFPPADAHCGERAAVTPAVTENAPKPVKKAKPAPDGARRASNAKKRTAEAE